MFRDIAWETIALTELEQRRREDDALRQTVTPELAQRVADTSFAYPHLSGGVAAAMAQAGLQPLTPAADELARRVAELDQTELENLNARPARGILDVGYSALKGTIRGLFTISSSIYDEIVKGIPSFATGLAQGMDWREAGRSSFGFSAGAIAGASLLQGRPVNLGSGFLPGGELSESTQLALDAGAPLSEAMQNQSQQQLGLPAFQFGEHQRETQGVQLESDDGGVSVPVTLGRLVANTIFEPGTRPFHYLSGATDFASNIVLDPAARTAGLAGKAARSNKVLTAGGARPSMLARGVDEWMTSTHGNAVMENLAGETNFKRIHDMLSNAQRTTPEAELVRALTDSSDIDEIRALFRGAVETGHINRTLGRQGVIQRGVQGLEDAFGANPRQIGTIHGWRGIVKDRVPTSWMDRMAADVGARSLSVADSVDQAVVDLGEWMKVAGFSEDRIGFHMGELARLQPGETERAFGVVTQVYDEFAQSLKDAGLSAPVVDGITNVFSDLDDARKYWVNQAGNPVLFPGGKFTARAGGELVALPGAHLWSEFLQNSIPLMDVRIVRSALRKRKWAERINADETSKIGKALGTSYLDRLDDADAFGPGALTTMMDAYMQKAWKPLTLLRLAWPVRVVGEEQLRLLGAGLDSGVSHPINWISMAIRKAQGKTDDAVDITGNPLEEAARHREAMSRGGDTLMYRQASKFDMKDWVKREKGAPGHMEGWAVQINHLADDPVAAALADELRKGIDAGDTDLLSAVDRVKARFWDGDLKEQRLRMSRDGRSWRMFTQRWASEGYVDSVLARIQQTTGGRWRAHDFVRGEWFDDLGERIPLDQAPPPPRRTRPLVASASTEVNSSYVPSVQRWDDVTGTLFDGNTTLRELVEGNDEVAALIWDTYRELADKIPNITGRQLDDYFDDLVGTDLDDALGTLLDRALDGTINRAEEAELQTLLSEIRTIAHQVKDEGLETLAPSGRAPMSARDMIDLTDPEGARDILGGYRPFGGSPSEGAAAVDELIEGTEGLRRGDLKRALADPETSLVSLPEAEQLRVDFDGVRTLPERPVYEQGKTGFHHQTTEIAHNGRVTGRIVVEYDNAGRAVDVKAHQVAQDSDGVSLFKNDAADLLRHVLDEAGEVDGTQIYDLAFGGVPARDWLASAGVDISETLSLREAVDIVRRQFGESWSRRGQGNLGDIPAIRVTEDGGDVLESVLTRGRRLAERARKRGDDSFDAMDPYTWSQDRTMYEITEWSQNRELLDAIADGQLGDVAVATAKATDVRPDKPKSIAQLARALEAHIDSAPQYTHVAKPMDPSAFDGADKVINSLFHYLGSVPTNTLSRSPAFKQFYWRRVAELYPIMDDAAQKAALENAANAGLSRSPREWLKAKFTGDDIEGVKAMFNRRADDFVEGRFDGVSGSIGLEEADEVAKAFALSETKALLYDVSKRSNFMDITRNIFPFGEAWVEIITTWARIVAERPQAAVRFQQGLEGARQSGFFYPDPSTGEEMFGFPGGDLISSWIMGGEGESPLSAAPTFQGRAAGLNIAGQVMPGFGPLVQLGVAKGFGNTINHPDFRVLRDAVFPFGAPDEEVGVLDVLAPAWFQKAMTAIGAPSAENERLFANTVTDVLRAMVINGEADLNSPEGYAEAYEIAEERARKIYFIRAATQFVGPTGASVRWDVESDRNGVAFTYQTLSSAYFEELDAAGGDHAEAMDTFIKLFGLDPLDPAEVAIGRESLASLARGKSRQIIPRSVTEEGLDWQSENPELFEQFPNTAYFANPDDPNAEFNYNAYLNQLRERTRVALSPDEWQRERNILLGNLAYQKAREGLVKTGNENKPEAQAWLRTLRFQLEEKYHGFGFGSLGESPVVADEARNEFEDWLDSPQMLATDAGQGLAIYLEARKRAVAVALRDGLIQAESGLASAKATQYLRDHLFSLAESISRQHPDFAAIFERYYAREVDNPVGQTPTVLAGVDLTRPEDN